MQEDLQSDPLYPYWVVPTYVQIYSSACRQDLSVVEHRAMGHRTLFLMPGPLACGGLTVNATCVLVVCHMTVGNDD